MKNPYPEHLLEISSLVKITQCRAQFSLTNSLRGQPNTLILLLKKIGEAKASYIFFNKKIGMFEILTNVN